MRTAKNALPEAILPDPSRGFGPAGSVTAGEFLGKTHDLSKTARY
jgi:hypothetical protein